MFSRRLLLAHLFLFCGVLLTGCFPKKTTPIGRLIVGVVSYDTGSRSLDKYERFKDYLAQQTNSIVEIEPAYNELNALEKIQRQVWSVVFAPPGLAAIAIAQKQYIPLFPMQGVSNLRSVIAVREDSPIQTIAHLGGKVIALGEPGSAAGYYLPLYDLYGLTLAEVRFAPTPKTVLEWISSGTVDAGALSEDEFERLQGEFSQTKFRIAHTSRGIPTGVVLLAPNLEPKQQERIKTAMSQAASHIAGDAGYIPNAKAPNYEEFIKLVEKVKPIEARVRQKPAVLTLVNSTGGN